MKNNDMTKLALKLAGLYMVIQSIFYIPSLGSSFFLMNLGQEGSQFGAMLLILVIVMLLVPGILLLLKTKPKTNNDLLSAKDLIPMGITLGGIMIFAFAARDLPLLISQVVYTEIISNPLDSYFQNTATENTMELVGNLIQLAIGAFLFFKAKTLAKFVS